MISFDYLANYYVVYVVNMHDDSLLFPSVSLQTAFKQSYNVVVQLVRRMLQHIEQALINWCVDDGCL